MFFEPEIIQSRQNRTVVEAAKLLDRKTREELRKFRFDGIKLCSEAFLRGVEVETLLLRESDAERVLSEIRSRCPDSAFAGNGRVLTLSDSVFDKISEEKSPEGVIVIAKYIDKFQKNITIYNSAQFFGGGGRSVLLVESVRDPSNVGAMIRSASAFGVDRLILSNDCADVYHPKAVRASMGTLFSLEIFRVPDLVPVISDLRREGRRVYAAALRKDAKTLGDFPISRLDCAVIGNEGHGLSDAVIEACDGSVLIPMTEGAESLNAAVAASVLMWEFFGKRR